MNNKQHTRPIQYKHNTKHFGLELLQRITITIISPHMMNRMYLLSLLYYYYFSRLRGTQFFHYCTHLLEFIFLKSYHIHISLYNIIDKWKRLIRFLSSCRHLTESLVSRKRHDEDVSVLSVLT